MNTRRRSGWRWLLRAALVLGGALVLIGVFVSLLLGTDAGRARLLEVLLTQVNEAIPGRLEVRALERIGPYGLSLRGVELFDPASSRVVLLESVHVKLAPSDLLERRIRLPLLGVASGQIDLRELQVPGRGVLAALIDPTAPAAPPSSEPPPAVVVDEIVLDDLEIRAPELPPPWHPLLVRRLQARAGLSLDPEPRLVVHSLGLELLRGEALLGRLTRAVARLEHPGEPSELELELELGTARARARARAVLTPPDAFEAEPLALELHVSDISAPGLSALLDDASLASAFEGPLELEAALSGNLDQLALSARLGSAGGPLSLQGQLVGRRRLAARLELANVELGRVRSGLPLAPLGAVLESDVELADAARIPFELRLLSANLGPHVLPELTARGAWSPSGVSDLELTAQRGASRLSAQGAVQTAGSLDVRLSAHVQRAELDTLATAAGLAAAPDGAVRADLRVARELDGRWLAQGTASVQALRLPQLALERARLKLDVAGVLPLLEGTAELALAGLTAGSLRVPRLDLRFVGSPRRGRVSASAELDRLQARLELYAEQLAQRWRLRGSASGRYRDTPFVLALAPTSVDAAGAVDVSALELRAGGQQLRVNGSYGRPGAELAARAERLEVGTLAELAGLGQRWTGTADLSLRLRGSPEQPTLDGSLRAAGLSPNGERPIDASLAAALDAAAGRASLDVAVRAGGDARLALALASDFGGGTGWAARLARAQHHLSLDARQIETAWLEAWLARPLPVHGRVDVSALLGGTLQQPSLEASLQAQLPGPFGLHRLELSQRIHYAAGRLGAELAVDDAAGRWLDLHGNLELSPEDMRDLTALGDRLARLGDSARYDAGLVLARRQLGSLWSEAPPHLAGLAIEGQLEASHERGAEPSARAALQVVETGAAGRSGAAAPGCSAAGVELALLGALSGGNFSAKLTAKGRDSELMRAEARAAVRLVPALRGSGPADLGALAAELSSRGLVLEQVPFLCQRLRGRVDARARLVDALGSQPSLTADVAVRGASLGAAPSLDLKLEAHADHDSASAAATIDAPTGRSTLSAELPIRWSRGRVQVTRDAPLAARAQLVALPLAPLIDPAGALSYVTGTVSGDVAVGGTVGAPEPSGTLQLADAELTATALAQPLHGVRGRFSFTRSSLRIDGFEAHDRDGVLSLSGDVVRSGDEALRVRLDARAKSFPLRQRGQVVATTSGRAKIDATLMGKRSQVSVKLMDADTWLEQAPTRRGIALEAHPDFVLKKAPDAVPVAGAPGAPVPDEAPGESHISIDASDHLWIKRDDFAIQLSARLDALVEGERATVKGRVDIYRGYLDLMGRVFEVERGSYLDFIGSSPPDPVVSISAAYEQRSAGKTVKVQIQGRGSKPQLKFFVDDVEVSAGEALEVLVGARSSGNETSAKQEATSFVSGLTAGLLATSARRELGAAAPIIMIEPGEQTGDGRIRAGFELGTLVPSALRQLITGVYVEGIVEREGSGNQGGQGQQATSTQAGVLLELYFPHQLFTTGQWGPGTTWSLDWGWQL